MVTSAVSASTPSAAPAKTLSLTAATAPRAAAATASPGHAVTTASQCWHVHHYGILTVKGGLNVKGGINMGVIHFAADICNDGQRAFLNSKGNQEGCWTDKGSYGEATVSKCGTRWDGNTMILYANMRTHGTADIRPLGVGTTLNIDSYNTLEDKVFPNTTQDQPTGSTDAWWAALEVHLSSTVRGLTSASPDADSAQIHHTGTLHDDGIR
jgi:hypothetical protein